MEDIPDCLVVGLSFSEAIATLGVGGPKRYLMGLAGYHEEIRPEKDPDWVRISSRAPTNNLDHAMTKALQTLREFSADNIHTAYLLVTVWMI